MKQSYYLFRNGAIRRKDNTLRVETEEGDIKDIPVERVMDIYCFGELNFNSKLLVFLGQKGICLHMFNYYENYVGTFYPRETLLSGDVHVRQAEHYLDGEKRLVLAKRFLDAGVSNMLRNLRYYSERGRDFKDEISSVRSLLKDMPRADSVQKLMGLEGNIRQIYYSCWNEILSVDTDFERRVRNPPDNMVNSLISFCNMLVYSTVVTEIYHSQLDPTISYLHQSGTRRFSLSLDIAEVFKPLLADRLIFTLVNKRQITQASFEKYGNGLLLRENARKEIVAAYDARLKQTIKHRELGKEVSYRRLIRLEAYKLIKHLVGEKEYEGFKIWW